MKKLTLVVLAVLLAFVRCQDHDHDHDHDHEDEHEHGYEMAVAIDIEEAGTYTWIITKSGHDDHDDHDHDHDHDHDRLLSGEEEEEEEPEYPFEHNAFIMQLLKTSCTQESIETIEEEAEEAFEDNATVFEEVDSGDVVLANSSEGIKNYELHPAEFTFTSLFFFDVSHSGCLVIFSEHELEDGFFRNDHGEEVEPSFVEGGESEGGNYDAETWLLTIGASLIVSLISLIGAIFLAFGLTRDTSVIQENSDEILAFAMGVLLGVVGLHLLPEANEFYGPLDWEFGAYFLGSILFAFAIRLFLEHGPHPTDILAGEDGKDDSQEIIEGKYQSSTLNVVWGDAFHNLSDGVLIGSAFALCGQAFGWVVTGGVILHEVPQELADFIVLYTNTGSVAKALALNLFSASTALLGAVIVLSLGELEAKSQGILLAINMGVLTFLCLGDLGPRLVTPVRSRQLTRLGLVIAGIFIIGLLQAAPHTHCESGGHEHSHG